MPEITIREATPADAAILADIERRSPIVTGEAKIQIDRGDDYFAAARLMGEYTAFLAEVDGAPGGVFGASPHPVLLGGVKRRMLYINHARILPRFQDMGLGKKLSERLGQKYKGAVDSHYWYISPDNEHSLAFARNATNRWTIDPTWVHIDTAKLAGPPFGRPAMPADAPLIADMLNAAHEGEEMFLPYTAASLEERLSRDPQQYSWANLWLSERAVAGVWREGDCISIRVTLPSGEVDESRGAGLMDYGYLPGGEAELVALIRAWCALLAAQGMAEFTLFDSPPTRHHHFLAPLGECSSFGFWTPSLPQPQGAETNGLYVDHIYF